MSWYVPVDELAIEEILYEEDQFLSYKMGELGEKYECITETYEYPVEEEDINFGLLRMWGMFLDEADSEKAKEHCEKLSEMDKSIFDMLFEEFTEISKVTPREVIEDFLESRWRRCV